MRHYEGEMDAERCVRVVDPDGALHSIEDDKGSERCKRVVDPDGTVRHYEGKARRAQSGVLRPCY